MNYLVLGITGKRGCGKDTVAQHLKKKYGFHVLVYTDDVLAPILRAQGKQVTRENLIRLATELRNQDGPAALTEMISERITSEGFWCISGVRLPEEVEFLRGFYGQVFKLMNVNCDDRKRYERVRSRGTKGEANITYEEFTETDKRVTEAPIAETGKLADFEVENNGTKEELNRHLDRIMDEIKSAESEDLGLDE
ncbi:MAG: AAA family ATPase [Candidatus Aenigmarchaeota archaeon]|nr:AAA family ATPase [Candidatus Aenigmarchaeota archaeon]